MTHAVEALSAASRDLAKALDAEVVLEIVVPCERPVADELARRRPKSRAASGLRLLPSCPSRPGS